MRNKITLETRDNIATIKLMDPENLNPQKKETLFLSKQRLT